MPVDTSSPPPRRTPPPSKPSPAKAAASAKANTARAQSVNSLFQLGQLGALMFGQYADAGAIAMHGPPAVQPIVDIAETTPWMAKGLDSLDIAGPWLALVAAMSPLVMQIMVNHGRIPIERVAALGVMPPAALEAEAKRQVAEQQRAALEMQRQAEAEYAAVAREAQQHAANGRVPETSAV